ncbi:B3 domain-containing protein [Canna indica]|uniref:B3 domain-containing protein n=1 Tax=Canna indica TaxID=4628 RepID=A0AAQ3KAL6_9LILI|nr:B3 domain-containing protein [Canna indica]
MKFKAMKDLEEVELKGPSGNKWRVKLTRSEQNAACFTLGWNNYFIRDHELEIDYFLVFIYDGNSCFEVQVFDLSGCEKEQAYFVQVKEEEERMFLFHLKLI